MSVQLDTMRVQTETIYMDSNKTHGCYYVWSPMRWDDTSGITLMEIKGGMRSVVGMAELPEFMKSLHSKGGYSFYRRLYDLKSSLCSMNTEFRNDLPHFDLVVGSDIHKITVNGETVYNHWYNPTDDSKRDAKFLLSELELGKTVILYSQGFRYEIVKNGCYRIYFIQDAMPRMNEEQYNENFA